MEKSLEMIHEWKHMQQFIDDAVIEVSDERFPMTFIRVLSLN